MTDGSRKPASGDSTLNRLVSELNLDERLNLLDKLKGQSNLSPEPLYEAGDEPENRESFDEQYARLPWYYRLCFFILSFFRGRPPNKIFEESQIGKLGREIDAAAPGLYDYQRNFLLAEFCRYLTDLKEGARFFFTALDASVNRDKGGFYAFLGSLEMEEVHKRLLSETDPEGIAEKSPEASEVEIRQIAFKAMEDAFAAITRDQRDAMYHNTRSLYCLKELSSFLYDRVIMAFGFGSSGQTCPVTVVKDLLITLNNILFSLKEPPPLPLLESLFVFLVQEKISAPDFDMSREMRRLLTGSENALVTIRSFNKEVPLTRILRCACRDLGLSPAQISGGEDWFLVYREYWKRQIEGKYAEYMRGRKHRDLLNSFRYFLKGTNLKILDNVVSDSNPDGLPVSEALSLSFLLTFYSAVFISDINKILRPILIDGEFFKRENRTEFTESYNDLIKLEDDIRKFERNIAPLGDYGKRYTLARQDISSLPVKRRKIQMVLEDASREAAEIIERSRVAMRTMINVLNGIMNRDPAGKYDTLGNLARLSGKTPVFINGVADTVQSFQKTLQLLDDIDAMESVR
jgi:hypothetical protein